MSIVEPDKHTLLKPGAETREEKSSIKVSQKIVDKKDKPTYTHTESTLRKNIQQQEVKQTGLSSNYTFY